MADRAASYEVFEELENEPAEDAALPTGACLLCSGALEECEEGLFDTRFGIAGRYEVRRCADCGLEQLFPAPDGRLLDIGCNEGRGLRLYAHNGFQVEGLELNETAASVARKAVFVVHTELLENFVPESPYEVAVLSNVLEHSLNPRRMLMDVHRVLTSGGQIWISCPNSLSWLRTVFGKHWINWHVPFHISHFSPETLRRLLAETGYVDVQVRQITPALWVAQSIIACLFSKQGRKTGQLRNPFLTLLLMMFARLAFFPALWAGNKLGHGDCLLASGTKA